MLRETFFYANTENCPKTSAIMESPIGVYCEAKDSEEGKEDGEEEGWEVLRY